MQWRTDATSQLKENGVQNLHKFQELLKITKKIQVVNNLKDEIFNSKNHCKVTLFFNSSNWSWCMQIIGNVNETSIMNEKYI